MRGSLHDKLWNQIEGEIHLHRHKTVIRACRGRKDPYNKPPKPPPLQSDSSNDDDTVNRKRRGIGEPRTIVIHKDKTEGLGISITVISVDCIQGALKGHLHQFITYKNIVLLNFKSEFYYEIRFRNYISYKTMQGSEITL